MIETYDRFEKFYCNTMTCFANEYLGRTSTSSTSMLVADEAYAGQAGPATAAGGKGLVQDGCWRDMFFPSSPYVLYTGPAGIFK